jgi:hypothetical protein
VVLPERYDGLRDLACWKGEMEEYELLQDVPGVIGEAGEECSEAGEEIGETPLDCRRRNGREGRM